MQQSVAEIRRLVSQANPAGGTLMIIRRLIAPLTAAVFAFHASTARAESALPGAAIGGAPSAFPSSGASPVDGGFAQPGPQAAAPGDECMNGFLPLRQEAEKRGALIKTADAQHAPPDEVCKLIGNFAQSEVKMIKFVEAHAQQCGIPAQVGEQLKTGHKNTEGMLKKVCDAAKQQDPRNPGGKDPKWLKIANRLDRRASR
jgi:hypothetical protein